MLVLLAGEKSPNAGHQRGTTYWRPLPPYIPYSHWRVLPPHWALDRMRAYGGRCDGRGVSVFPADNDGMRGTLPLT